MGERALAWGLRLLGIALVIGPLLIALGTHNWDIKAAVLPSENEMKQIENSVTGIFGGGPSENTFNYSILPPADGNIRVSIQFTSPFNVPIKIDNISASVSYQGGGKENVYLENEVEVPAQATVNFMLIGTYTGVLPTNPQLSSADITFESYGVTVSVRIVGGQGGS
jgi:hypothetical protein